MYKEGIRILRYYTMLAKGIRIVLKRFPEAEAYSSVEQYLDILNLEEEYDSDKGWKEYENMKIQFEKELKQLKPGNGNVIIRNIVIHMERWYENSTTLVNKIREFRYLEQKLQENEQKLEIVPIEELIEKLEKPLPRKKLGIIPGY